MARNIGADGTDVFRAVIDCRYPKGGTELKHEGPYGSIGAARGRVTFWENYLHDDEDDQVGASGHVERAVTRWVPIDEHGQDVETAADSDQLAELLRVISETVTEANDVGGIDLNDLVDRVEALGHKLPDPPDDDN